MSVSGSTAAADLEATVAICAYNAAGRIEFVIRALATQDMPPAGWEVLIVDNASADGTGELAGKLMKELLTCSIHVVREETPGLAFARKRAAREARGKVICFLDDDNLPERDFVRNAIRIFAVRPKTGAIGGKVLAAWDTPPSPLALAVQNFALAICDLGEKPIRHEMNIGPVGAGLCIRSELLRDIYANENSLRGAIGRTGKNAAGGDDLALGVLTWQLGYECWYEPSLVLQHKLPARRMEKDYLLKLYEGIGRGQAEVRQLYDWKARTPLNGLIGLKDFCRWQLDKWRGPSAELRQKHPEIADEVHDLGQRLVWGRASQAISAIWR
jgi:glycosyltransferase involved in cell wall biosynthesis